MAKALRRRWRRLMASVGRPRVQLVYRVRYQIEMPSVTHDSQRGERILAFLDAEGMLDPRALHRPELASFRLLRRIHTDDYLDSLNRPGSLVSVVGFSPPEHLVEKFLEAQRAMAGGTVLAARLARESGGIGINLGGGLHHAFAAKGARFCVFNDVAAAITDLRLNGFAGPVLVVDLDVHDGDGTRSLFAADPTVYTFSIHNQTNPQPGEDAVASTAIELGGGVDDATYLEAIRTHLPPVFASFRPEMVFYLAGNDPAADDLIGDWKISADGLLERDRFVLASTRGSAHSRPLVIVLAGGYGQESWRYSARFFSFLIQGSVVEPPLAEEAVLQRYRQLARSYGEPELTGDPKSGDDWGLTAEDIGMALGGPHRPHRLLGYYSLQGLELALERTGFLDLLRNRGFEPVAEMELESSTGDTLRVYGDRRRTELIIEARMRIDRHAIPGLALLRIEWLLLQNPRVPFSHDRPRLPGQRHPGLGMLQDIMALFVLACDRLQLDGVLFVPAHYHTATYGRRLLRFVDPVDEGRVRAMRTALEGMPLAQATLAVDQGKIVDTETGRPVPWQPRPLVFPVSDRLREKVESEEYERQAAETAGRLHFALRG